MKKDKKYRTLTESSLAVDKARGEKKLHKTFIQEDYINDFFDAIPR